LDSKNRIYKIGDIAKIVGGGTPKTSDESLFDGDIPWITPKDMSTNRSMFTSVGKRNITKKGLSSSSAKILPPRSILISSRAPVGLLTISKQSLSTNQGIRSLILDEEIANPEYVYYKLRTMLPVLEAYSSGATFPEISGKSLSNISIDLPPLAQQISISKKLMTIDQMIENLMATISLIDKKMSLIFQSWFVTYDLVKAKSDDNISMLFPDQFEDSEIGLIPAGWKVISLEDCIQANARVGWKGLTVAEYTDSGPYIVTGPQLVSGQVLWENCGHVSLDRYDESPDIQLEENDILLSKDGTIGKVALVHSMPGKATLAAGLFRLRAREEICGHCFVYCLLNSYLFKSLIWTRVEGAVIPHLYQVHLRAFKFAVPDQELMRDFEKIIHPLMEQMKSLNQLVKCLRELRDSLNIILCMEK